MFLGAEKHKYWQAVFILMHCKTFIVLPDKHDTAEIREWLQRDPERAMEYLFSTYFPMLCRVVYRIIPVPETAEDIVQDVFYELWRKRKQLTFSSSVAGYLKRSAINKSLNYVRDHKHHLLETPLKPIHSPAPSVPQQLAADELQKRIEEEIDRLPERCRVIFVLSRFEDMSYQEIADKLGISRKTVENQVSKALRTLRERLGPLLI